MAAMRCPVILIGSLVTPALTELFEVATFQVLRSQDSAATLEVVHALPDGRRPS